MHYIILDKLVYCIPNEVYSQLIKVCADWVEVKTKNNLEDRMDKPFCEWIKQMDDAAVQWNDMIDYMKYIKATYKALSIEVDNLDLARYDRECAKCLAEDIKLDKKHGFHENHSQS